jgi:hypothetical protein
METRSELAYRCDLLLKAYRSKAVLVIPKATAETHGLADIAKNPTEYDPGFRLTTVDVCAAAAVRRLRVAA